MSVAFESLEVSSFTRIEELHNIIRDSIPQLFEFMDTGGSYVRQIAATSLSDLAAFGEGSFQIIVHNLFGLIDNLRGLTHNGVPPLIKLLSDHRLIVRSSATTSLSRLASYGEC